MASPTTIAEAQPEEREPYFDRSGTAMDTLVAGEAAIRRLEEVRHTFKTMNANLAQHEANSAKHDETLFSLAQQATERARNLQLQVGELENDLAKVSRDLDQTRREVEEELARSHLDDAQLHVQCANHAPGDRIESIHQPVLHTSVDADEEPNRPRAGEASAQDNPTEPAIGVVPQESPGGRGDAERTVAPVAPARASSEENPAPDQGGVIQTTSDASEDGTYTEYWKLSCLPFEAAPDPKFFFESREHREGITRVCFSVQTRKALAVLTGDYGSGKSVLCRTVIERLAPRQFKIAFVSSPHMNALDLIREIAYQLGEDIPSTSRYDILRAFNGLLDRHRAAGRHCAAIIDEAQVITEPSILEDVRLFLNHQVSGMFLLTLVLVGQTELNDMLRRIPQMLQRIGLKFHVQSLAADEVGDYIRHRLETAGGTLDIFEKPAIVEVGRLSKGNPREINAICDMALLTAALSGRARVAVEDVVEAGKERT